MNETLETAKLRGFEFNDSCDDMRAKSGNAETNDPIVALLYLIARDELTPGAFTTKVDSIIATLRGHSKEPMKYTVTNGFIMQHIRYELNRIKEALEERAKPAPVKDEKEYLSGLNKKYALCEGTKSAIAAEVEALADRLAQREVEKSEKRDAVE